MPAASAGTAAHTSVGTHNPLASPVQVSALLMNIHYLYNLLYTAYIVVIIKLYIHNYAGHFLIDRTMDKIVLAAK